MRRALTWSSALVVACSSPPAPAADVGVDAPLSIDAAFHDTNVVPGSTWCSIGTPVIQGTLPPGYCVRLFAGSPDNVAAHSPVVEPRVMAAAPNGDLFVSAPATATPGGANGGPGAILVLSDDDQDGVAEVHTFLAGVPDVHGLVLASDALYFTTANSVSRLSYTTGQRAAVGTPEVVSSVPTPGRWTHGLARSTSGAMYVSNGVLSASCPAAGGYVAELGTGDPTMVAVGLRNPMFVRCHHDTDLCVAAEMGDDGGAAYGAREKLLVLRAGTNYGYPCCAGPNLPAVDGASCADITPEEVVIPLGNSPFGFDWERGLWDGEMRGVLCIAQHGSFYSSPPWLGEGVYCTPTDPVTHVPTDGFTMFLGGFGPANASAARMLRPADVVFGVDGRMYVADDTADAIYWVAPEGLVRPGHG